MLRRAWNTESRSWRAAAVCLGLALFHLTPIPALADLDRASQAETVNRALQQGDHERALEALQPLVEAGDEQAIKFDRFIRAFVELLKQREAQKKAEGPIDLRDFDGRYEPMVPGPQQRRFALGQEAYEREDYETAFREWLPLADGGYAEAQYEIADLFRFGKGVETDSANAESYYLKAARQGYAPAQLALAMIDNSFFFTKDEDVQRNNFSWAHRAAVNGSANAYILLSFAYCTGRGTDRNPVLADVWSYMAYPSEEDLYRDTCNKGIKYFKSYFMAIRERAEAMSDAYDIRIVPREE